MPLTLNLSVRNARSTALKAAIDAGSGDAVVEFYTLPLPTANGEAITSQGLVAVCILAKPCGTVANGQLTFDVVMPDLVANATGSIAFGRIKSGTGDFIGDGDAGLANSAAMFRFNKVTALAGGIVKLLSVIITEGNA